ncbi:MAG: HEAT repeat domain-containing protein [Verrucomicrobia bacterium]|nr:HEAT repeat domain-containing protein [Verrucomicrobiota bacterium]
MKPVVNNLLVLAALSLSIAAFLISLDLKTEDLVQTTTGDRIEELEREIAHLKGTVFEADLVASEGTVSTIQQIELTNIDSSEQEKINHMVESMRWTMTVRGVMQPTKEHLEKAERQIFDDSISLKRKLVALRILQVCDKRTDEIACKMVDAYYTTSDFNMQAEIFNLLDDMDTPELATALLEASSSSPNPRVRKEAIDALSGFLPDPELFIWLKRVASSDSDKDVRREAERLLKKHAEDLVN